MEKGNKVLIKDTGSIWDGKRGTVISEEDGQVEVRINFETEDGTKQVIEIFNEENLEMEREDESLNEEINEEEGFKPGDEVIMLMRGSDAFGKKGKIESVADVVRFGLSKEKPTDKYAFYVVDFGEGKKYTVQGVNLKLVRHNENEIPNEEVDEEGFKPGDKVKVTNPYKLTGEIGIIEGEADIVRVGLSRQKPTGRNGFYTVNFGPKIGKYTFPGRSLELVKEENESLNEQAINEMKSKARIILTAEVYQGDYSEPIHWEAEGIDNAACLWNIYTQIWSDENAQVFTYDKPPFYVLDDSGNPEEFKSMLEFQKEDFLNDTDYDEEDKEKVRQINIDDIMKEYFNYYEISQSDYESRDPDILIKRIRKQFGRGDEWYLIKVYDAVNKTILYSISESLQESLNYKKTDDIIHPYVYLQDLDDKEISAWNFASRIATAEDIEEGCVCELAHDLGYKVFVIEAPGFFRTAIAAKGIKAEDIQEEFADFLQGRACVRELELK